jgi:hypothetical protein
MRIRTTRGPTITLFPAPPVLPPHSSRCQPRAKISIFPERECVSTGSWFRHRGNPILGIRINSRRILAGKLNADAGYCPKPRSPCTWTAINMSKARMQRLKQRRREHGDRNRALGVLTDRVTELFSPLAVGPATNSPRSLVISMTGQTLGNYLPSSLLQFRSRNSLAIPTAIEAGRKLSRPMSLFQMR